MRHDELSLKLRCSRWLVNAFVRSSAFRGAGSRIVPSSGAFSDSARIPITRVPTLRSACLLACLLFWLGPTTCFISSTTSTIRRKAVRRSEGDRGADLPTGHQGMSVTIRHVRLFLLGGIFVCLLYLTLACISEGSSERVYLCNTTGTSVAGGGPSFVECGGLDDSTSCASGTKCVRSSCGFKLGGWVKIDVSVSGASDPLGPPTPTDALSIAMVFYSIVPYLLGVFLAAALVFAGDTATLSCLALFGLTTLVNEAVFKKLVQQRRPPGSCLYFHGFGMPSGHAAGSIGQLTYLLLETWVDRPDTPIARKLGASFAVLALLAPVPYSRVHLNDHFPVQVIAGATEGAAIALLWFGFVYLVARPRLDSWVDSRTGPCRCLRLRNTYRSGQQWAPDWWSGDGLSAQISDPAAAASLGDRRRPLASHADGAPLPNDRELHKQV